MELVKASCDNLASVLMGKNIQFPWRGQRDVVISVSYIEWIKFIRNYYGYFVNRSPLNYQSAVSSVGTEVSLRYFWYDISWAQYSELACSSNIKEDATLILPHFDDGRDITISDALSELDAFDYETISKFHSRLRGVTRNYFNLIGASDISFGLVNLSNLSEWNSLVFKLCIYLQSRSDNRAKTEKLNIDWRSL